MTLISVVVPAYNVSNYIGKCINSILSQDFSNIELLIINDGSTDQTGEVADKYAREDKRIHVYHKANGGVSSARNLGIRKSTGKYICFVDSDDVITLNALGSMYEAMKKSGCDICVYGLAGFQNYARIPEKSKLDSYKTYTSTEALRMLLYEKEILNSQCAKLYKNDAVKNIYFDEKLAYGEDMFFNYNVFKNAKKIAVSHQVVYYYLKRPGSAMQTGFSLKRADSLVAAQKIEASVNSKGIKTLYEAAYNKVFTEAVSVAALIPAAERNNSKLFAECMTIIQNSKHRIYHNPHTRWKNKIFSCIALINEATLIRLLYLKNLIRRRLA